MVDVWWGIVERDAPKQYDFAGYRALFERIRNAGLEIQVSSHRYSASSVIFVHNRSALLTLCHLLPHLQSSKQPESTDARQTEIECMPLHGLICVFNSAFTYFVTCFLTCWLKRQCIQIPCIPQLRFVL
jgi:hypothetical protein